MTKILRLDSSVAADASVSTKLNALLVETLNADGTASVVHRDVTSLPSLSAELFGANMTPAADRSPAQTELAATADACIAELIDADVIVIAAPIYNFGLPSGLKAWMDLVARAGATFAYTPEGPKGLLPEGKKAYVVAPSGGVPLGSPMDFGTPHIQLFLGFLGITDVTVIDASGLNQNPAKLAEAEAAIGAL